MIPFSQAQESEKSRKEQREERKATELQNVKKMLSGKEFVFNATQAMPLGGGNIRLNYYYNVKISGDTIVSYLPFYGVAYQMDYGGRNSGFDFTQPIEKYELSEKKNDGYLLDIEVKNNMDYLNYVFFISELGYSTLNVSSSKRQAITYYGKIELLDD